MSKNKQNSEEQGRFAYEGLDRVIHEKARLGIVTSLATHPLGLSFNDLKDLCDLTDGNLSRHLQTLGEAGLVDISKEHTSSRTQTMVRLTATGKRRFLEYISVLESIVGDALEARQTGKAPQHAKPGWSLT
jgi:DNA-binding MarR family transcriptional regulator